jgi:hypothetical protein
MEGQLFQYGLFVPALILLLGVIAMSKGIIRYAISSFKVGLYFAAGAFIIIALILALRIATGLKLSGVEIGLVCTSLAMFLAVTFSIVYEYIHRVLPDFFINSSLVFSLFCLVNIGVNFYDKDTTSNAAKNNPNRFIDSEQYQTKQQKAEATYASQTELTVLPL